jgi:hypothetical protein
MRTSDETVRIAFTRHAVAFNDRSVRIHGSDTWIPRKYVVNHNEDGSLPKQVEADVPTWFYNNRLKHNAWVKIIETPSH